MSNIYIIKCLECSDWESGNSSHQKIGYCNILERITEFNYECECGRCKNNKLERRKK
jgi:hypothetical protein